MQSRPTIIDVAAKAGVSRQTVSRVINNKGEVSDTTRDRVLEAIDELGYRPNAAARSMVMGRTCTLGCISPSLTDYTFANIIDSAQAEARRLGYFVLASSARTEQEVEPLLEEMLHRQVDGLLVLNPHADRRYEYFLPLVEAGMAVVYLNNTPRGECVSAVRCDDRDGGYQATRHLLDLGHTAIATILGPSNEECTFDRLEGYRQALADAGLTDVPELKMQGDWSATSGYEAMQRVLQAGPVFSALFAQNDQMAVGAIRALREEKRRVPEDVSIVGFDDIPLASYFDPPLTTLRQPMQESGRQAARLLVETIHNPGRAPEQIAIPARLVVRASSAPLCA
ncbi:MAG: LacI family DNA-binding transcriptional regulator [Anaerolineae bacterium]|nr:LacI family DNA-binding transcriptional regulator [Anaerolineae bacterium]